MFKTLKLSIVIPVFNEENYIVDCLRSIAQQSRLPDEVIVVNNNCTDKTLSLIKRFDFVKLVNEPRQGRTYAQMTGFDSASGDIFGRIDADSRLEKDWVKKVVDFFESQPQISAIAGKGYFYDFPLRKLTSAAHYFGYYLSQKLITSSNILWGSNMAIKREVWQQVRNSCLVGDDIDEDIDLSLHLLDAKKTIARQNNLVADVSMRRGDLGFLSTVIYLSTWPRTYWRNHRYFQAAYIYAVMSLIVIMGIPWYIKQLLTK